MRPGLAASVRLLRLVVLGLAAAWLGLVTARASLAWPTLGLLALLAAAGAAGAFYRRRPTPGLGLGAACVPAAIALAGPLGAWVAAIVGAVRGWWRGADPEGRPRPSHHPLRGTLEGVLEHALAGLVAATAWQALGATPAALAGAGLAWLASLALTHAAATPPWQAADRRATSRAALLEAVAWTAGLVLALAERRGGAGLLVGLILLLAALAAEAGRQRLRRNRAEGRLRAHEELHAAEARLAGGFGGTDDLARRVVAEVQVVAPEAWVELVLFPGQEEERRFHHAPGHGTVPGPAPLPAHPPPLPGIHRRGRWREWSGRLTGGDAELAVLHVWDDARRHDPETDRLLDRLVPRLASLLHRAVLDRQAKQDPLTGLALRRVMDHALETAFERCREQGGQIAVALADLDFFKRVNDRWGHAAGDRALAAVGATLSTHVRGGLCARYGGEEMAVVLEDCDGPAALAVAERLRQAVEALEVEHEGQALPLTLSVGVASFPEVWCRQPAELLQLADSALYEAKRLGRNCALLYCGGGRYRDAKGRTVDTGTGEAVRPPQLLA